MDPEFALVKLQLDLLDVPEPDTDALPELMDAVIAAAQTQQGYSGPVWKAGARILDIAQKHGQDPSQLFGEFGWSALARALHSSLQNNDLLQALSYASQPFLPPSGPLPIFDHPQVAEAIRTALVGNPRPFIKPSQLSLAEPAVQSQFGELLNRLGGLSADNEVLLQWSSSALRALPVQSECHKVAAVSLLRALHSEKRPAIAYYTFRALAEQHEDLWQQPLVLSILQAFVEQYRQDEKAGVEVLNRLCADDDLLRRAGENLDLLTLVGALGIDLTRRYGYTEAEAVAWRFVNEMYGSYTLVAHALSEYLAEGKLPTRLTAWANQLRDLREQSDQALESAQKELRTRRYAQLPLAAKIYQSNLQDVFSPLLEKIRAGRCSRALIKHIQELDPEKLVSESQGQRSSRYPIDGRILRKMIRDNAQILEALESAARKRLELDETQSDLANQSSDEYELYGEFSSLLDCLGEVATWSLRTLLSDFWQIAHEGLSIVRREQEDSHYGERYC